MDKLEFKCKKCGNENYQLRAKGTAMGLYCAKCGFWHKWLNKAERERYKQPELNVCEWHEVGEGNVWESDCGNAFIFSDGTPAENHFKFCPYCGRPLKTEVTHG